MKKSYNLIKAWNKPIFQELKGTYKKLDETGRYPIFPMSHKVDEIHQYGEKVWMNEQVNNYVKSIRLSKQESLNSDSIDSGIFDSSTYCKSSTSLSHTSISANFFRSIWKSEEKINIIGENFQRIFKN